MMLKLDGAVGRGGRNLIQDVAVIQTAFKAASPKGRGSLWPGRIDGRPSRELEAAIAACQKAVRVPVSGRIEATGSVLRRLEQEMPPSHRGMRGMRGTAEVFLAPPGRTWEQAARDAETKAPLPAAERKALAALMRQAGGELDLPLALVETTVTVAGNFRVLLSGDNVAWLDPSGQRFTKHARLPQQAARALVRLARGNAAWTPRAVPDALELVSLHAIQALIGPPKLDRATLDSLAIATAPTHPVAQACTAACAILIAKGEHTRGSGKLDFAALVDAIHPTEPKITERLIELAQPVERAAPPLERDAGRPLTTGEIALAQPIFGSKISYGDVTIYKGKFATQQADNVIMTPDGNIYVGPAAKYSTDYSLESEYWRGIFIHEMTHVWQNHELGIGPSDFFFRRLGQLFDPDYAYPTLTLSDKFLGFNIEQQASIVEDYYHLSLRQMLPSAGKFNIYKSVIPFVAP